MDGRISEGLQCPAKIQETAAPSVPGCHGLVQHPSIALARSIRRGKWSKAKMSPYHLFPSDAANIRMSSLRNGHVLSRLQFAAMDFLCLKS